MDFEQYLNEGKLYATSKDGVRKQVKNDREAAEWRNTVAKPPKPEKAAKVDHLPEIARIIQHEVGNHYPDSDGWDAINSKVRKLTGVRDPYEASQLMDKAAKKHLQAKSFGHYVDHFGDELPK